MVRGGGLRPITVVVLFSPSPTGRVGEDGGTRDTITSVCVTTRIICPLNQVDKSGVSHLQMDIHFNDKGRCPIPVQNNADRFSFLDRQPVV